MTLTLDQAQIIVSAAREEARRLELKPLTYTVVDAGGHIILTVREDGSSPMRPKISHGKAHGAVMMGIGTRAIFERAERQPYFVQAMNGLADGALVPSPGGVLIKDGDDIIGALGITGETPDNDEACALAGVKAAGLTPEPN
ncbi:MAG: heme-binding protein [Alphaproteobacteria bacterium]|nr:heme-binding protein [Alphaproteobacteria bacterium]